MSAIEMWFDGGGSYGFGNVRRSRELGEVLRRRGHAVRFVPLSDRARALLPCDEGIAGTGGLAVLDVPYDGDAVVEAARAKRMKVVALDYQGGVAPDLIISLQKRPRLPDDCRLLCGTHFAIIREEIRSLGTEHDSHDEVLVIVGGGDQDGLGSRIVNRLPGLGICVVQGPVALSPLSIQRQNVRVVTSPPDLPQLKARCAWAVTTGGTTMLELLCLGKAVHVVPRTTLEHEFSQRFARESALLGVGLDSLCVPSLEQINACQRRGPQLVDGRGSQRIANEIEWILCPTIDG